MKRVAISSLLLALTAVAVLPFFAGSVLAADLPTDEASAIAYFTAKGADIKLDDAGHAIRFVSSGAPALTVEEYQRIGLLTHLQQMGLNSSPLADDQWGFLKQLPQLKSLSIWHGKGFTTLEPFSGLPVESLTIGGCMGLRDLNKDDVNKHRNAVTTLHDLPQLKRVSLYHTPLAPDDSHLQHLASSFTTLEDLSLDFSSPRGTETSITPAGLAALQKLPLKVLKVEHVESFTAEHFAAIAGIKSLTTLLVDARRNPVSPEAVAAFEKLRPDVEVVIGKPGDARPPTAKRR
ncbi:leucine-rich repeat domain-containing protein [Lignipirellula cremea]|uniref:Leucine Rich repeats (2 copies) n=1 Tax=Lignipirellula cremea TaxID=2528010 RepID=A0A518DM26_9BACT|nr:hypothetical protein [Lignipirellula cremea]QDU92896.1 hypothetical protein Pla8534_06690 [Lignipirellula cremea]